MKLLCWNCQGLGTPLTVQALRTLVAQDRPDVVFLMETKNQVVVVRRTSRKLGFSNYCVVNSIGSGGGLALMS